MLSGLGMLSKLSKLSGLSMLSELSLLSGVDYVDRVEGLLMIACSISDILEKFSGPPCSTLHQTRL